jgi:long-chain acyl-CoA synthetase
MRLVDELLSISADRLNGVAWIERDLNSNFVRSWTWADVKLITASAARFLSDNAVEPGDRVVNLGRNSLAWVVLDLACSALNAVHVPIDWRLSQTQRAQCIELVEPKMVFSNAPIVRGELAHEEHSLSELMELPDISQGLEEIVSPYQSSDLANILFTSGTTGRPRGVMLSHKNLITNAYAKLDAMPQHASDHRLNFLPFSHAYARTCELTTWLISRSSMEVVSGIEGALNSAPDIQPTLINGVPAFYDRLMAEWSPSGCTKSGLVKILGTRLRRLASGGASLSHSVRSSFAKVGTPIYQGYGLTESSPVICSNREEHGSEFENMTEVGPPVNGVEVKIDSDSRLWVKGDGVMQGYWRDPDATRAKMDDHWLDTGDLAEFVSDSPTEKRKRAIRILGRADDTVVLSTGYKVCPFPIEQIMNDQPWVSQCMLVGRNRTHTSLLIRLTSSAEATPISLAEYQTKIAMLLRDFPKHAIPKELVLVDRDWTSDNGMTNFKGGLNRRRIEAEFEKTMQLKNTRSK